MSAQGFLCLTCSSTLADDGDVLRVPAKACNVLLDPANGISLVAQLVVGLVPLLTELRRRQQSGEPETEAMVLALSPAALPVSGEAHLIPTPMTGTPLSVASLTTFAWS